PATTGQANPFSTGQRQATLGASFQGASFSAVLPSRRGPSHCGQSSARAAGAASNNTRAVLSHGMGGSPGGGCGKGHRKSVSCLPYWAYLTLNQARKSR